VNDNHFRSALECAASQVAAFTSKQQWRPVVGFRDTIVYLRNRNSSL